MVRYEVTVMVREDLRDRFERYFVEKHIPEILATGCFLDIRFDRSDAGTFRTVYHAATRADLERYLSHFTVRSPAHFASHLPDGVAPSGENWTEVKNWQA